MGKEYAAKSSGKRNLDDHILHVLQRKFYLLFTSHNFWGTVCAGLEKNINCGKQTSLFV